MGEPGGRIISEEPPNKYKKYLVREMSKTSEQQHLRGCAV